MKKILFALAALALLVHSAPGLTRGDETDIAPNATDETQTEGVEMARGEDAQALNAGGTALAIGRDEAANIARNATGGAQVERIAREDGVYEVTLRGEDARYQVEVLGAGGAVLEIETTYTEAGRGTRFALSEADARNAAAAVAPEAANGLVNRALDGEGSAYEVFFASNGTAGEIDVNAETGAILRVTTYPEAAAQGVLSLEAVASRLDQRLPGVQLAEIELDWDDGGYRYEGEAVSGDRRYDFEMNAVTGAITEFERDD